MQRRTVLTGVLCVLATAFVVAAKDASQITGTWDITIDSPNGTINEQMVVQQKGEKVTGKVKTAHGDVPLEGTVQGGTVRLQVTNGDMKYQIRANLAGDSMDGTIKIGSDELVWRAKRAKSS